MEQKRFSTLIFKFLEQTFPEFIPTIKYQDDGSFDCDLKSPSGKFSIWIATYNSEITFGLEAPNGNTDIHAHVTCYEDDDFNECITVLTKMINEVKDNKLILYFNDKEVYDWIEIDRLLKIEHKKGKKFKKYFWAEN
jgi:hypothetical protein